MKNISTTKRRNERGMSLVELMISLALGLFLVAGALQIFAGNRVTYKFNEGLSRIQENARFALNHLTFNARMAGYLGCLPDVAVFNNLNTPDPFRDDLRNGLRGHDANGTATGQTYSAASSYPSPGSDPNAWTPALPAQLAGRVIPGSDVLIVRKVAGDAVPMIAPFTSGAQMFVDPVNNFQEGDVLVATDCAKASIFQVTNVNNNSGKTNLVHSSGGGYAPGNAVSSWGSEQAYGLGAEIAELRTYAFYIGQGADQRPSLFQLRLQRLNSTTTAFVPEELVQGVESMQVRYGIDTDNDDAADTWVSADATADWLRVLSVELSLLVRAPDEYGTETDTVVYELGGVRFNPVDDRRLREVFSSTVGLRNRLP